MTEKVQHWHPDTLVKSTSFVGLQAVLSALNTNHEEFQTACSRNECIPETAPMLYLLPPFQPPSANLHSRPRPRHPPHAERPATREQRCGLVLPPPSLRVLVPVALSFEHIFLGNKSCR